MLWPENTSFAFDQAAALGVELFETDLRVTADGALICFHDATLDRTTNGQGLTAKSMLAEVAALDAGYRHRYEDRFPFRSQGCAVPTFEAVVERFPQAGFIVDLKADGTEEPLARLIEERHLRQRVIVGSFSDQRLGRFRELTRGMVATSTAPNETMRAIVASRSGGRWNPFSASTVAMQVPVSWYGVPVVTRRLVELAHRWDRLVHVWTINETSEMDRLFELGVDEIITDRPDLALALLSPPSGPEV
ncbi:MAG: glycerophosphodiester phosphodiesterase [Actinobacteria bacterium]|nr:glycerophosphodiester phosphodiesterase [Actinomycetota bacterium]